jgi:subtilase family serine protease
VTGNGPVARKKETGTAMLRHIVLSLILTGTTPVAPAECASRPPVLVGLVGRNEAGLTALLERQHDAGSADYRRWLTPQEFGQRFGTTAADLRRASRWLRSEGCRVRRFASRRLLACVGRQRLEVPAALRHIVTEILAADEPLERVTRITPSTTQPQAIIDGMRVLEPGEFPRIYGLGAAIGPDVDGSGQTIGLLGFARVDPADVATFRQAAGFAALELEQIGAAGDATPENLLEAALDVEWSGAIAPGARIVLAVGETVADSFAALVDRNVDVISSSISLCPSRQSRRFIREALRLIRQASAQGQTVFQASGDEGATFCNKRQVDPMVASPWGTAVGGTDPSPEQDATGAFVAYGTEVVWDDTDGASGGGRSSRPRPGWQRKGVTRTVPDVAFPASVIYPVVLGGQAVLVGGTSAAAPAWAGAIAQLNQLLGRRVGFLNPELYRLGQEQQRGGAAVFHDVTQGTSTFNGVRGFPARPGYDLATGWGSMNGPEFFAAFAR